MKLDMVGRTPSEVLGLQRDMLERLSGNEGDLWLERYKRLHSGENPFAELVGASVPADAWKDALVATARKKLGKFSSAWAKQVTSVPTAWTPQSIADVAAYNMRPVFFPDADINEAFQHRKYTKPGKWYYDNIRSGAVKGDTPTRLRPGWALADFSVGTDYTDGTQVLPTDPWAGLIGDLRGKKLVGAYDTTPLGSRFAITWDEWNDVVLAHMAAKLCATRAQTSLERAVEFNFIGNVYDPSRGRFNMWVWFQDAFGGVYRLIGGVRGDGGLASVGYYWRGRRGGDVAGRPLVRFVQ